MFQSLTWVERLSDLRAVGRGGDFDGCFNPSPGLNVFQTPPFPSPLFLKDKFQSLTWVERLSD